MVRQRTTQILSIQNLLARNLSPLRPAILSGWQAPDIDALALLPEQALAVQANLAVMHCLDEQIHGLEHAILERATLREDYRALQTVSGIGKVLALTIALETGDIERFASPAISLPTPARSAAGASRTARKRRRQHQVRQPAPGLGLVEAAHFAVRYNERIKRFYQKKSARTLPVVAIKAVAHSWRGRATTS
ncbi:MAG: transposase [Zoogloeaceae bacterium]|nr:transposase [Zoogloeaceae bacterium]